MNLCIQINYVLLDEYFRPNMRGHLFSGSIEVSEAFETYCEMRDNIMLSQLLEFLYFDILALCGQFCRLVFDSLRS